MINTKSLLHILLPRGLWRRWRWRLLLINKAKAKAQPTWFPHHRQLDTQPKMITTLPLKSLKLNPGVMASGRAVVLPCAAAVSWTPASDPSKPCLKEDSY